MSANAETALTDPLRRLFSQYSDDRGMVFDGITDLRALFADMPNGADAPLTFEIGFGMGSSLIEMALMNPLATLLASRCMNLGLVNVLTTKENGLQNLKLINGDAIKLMGQLPNNHIDRIQLYFPDLWQKRHFKRRFVSPERMAIVTRCLEVGGEFHAATDWEDYAFWMLNVLDNFDGLTNTAGTGNFMPRPDYRPLTKFEKRGIERGHGVWDLVYVKD